MQSGPVFRAAADHLGNMSQVEKELAQSGDEDEELEQMKARVREMEAEAEKLRTMTADAPSAGSTGSGGEMAADFGEESAEVVDGRSIYVGNVSFSVCRGTADWRRWTMGRRQRSSRRTFRRWGRSTGLRYCATSLRGIPRGEDI